MATDGLWDVFPYERKENFEELDRISFEKFGEFLKEKAIEYQSQDNISIITIQFN
jgi:serine/threonine protein phosphatase PrpC